MAKGKARPSKSKAKPKGKGRIIGVVHPKIAMQVKYNAKGEPRKR